MSTCPLPTPGCLRDLPRSARILVTGFLAIIGFGYIIAVANISYRHALADGIPGLSLDDLRAVYSGLSLPAGQRSELPSRMLTMIRGEMRQYFSSDENFSILESWLKGGAKKEKLEKGPPRRTPQRVIIGDCLRCHAKSTRTDISKEAPFGADEFDVDYALVSRFTCGQSAAPDAPALAPPQYSIPRLILVSHQHMLSIPLFTLIIGGLFLLTRVPPTPRHILGPLPMIALLFDFGGWWLARYADLFVYSIAASGAIFGLVFGFQILAITWELWQPRSPDPRP